MLAMLAIGCASQKRPAASDQPDDVTAADKHYDVAVGSFHNGMFEDAKVQLNRALTADEQHAPSLYLKGIIALHEGKAMIDAIEIDRCLQDAAASQQRKRAEELHAQAAAAFEQATVRFEENAAGRGRAYNSLAVVDLYFHRYEDALRHARQALEVQFYTDRFSALSNLGWAHYHLGDLVSATADLRQALMVNPDYCVGRYRLAQVYLESDLAELALEQAQAVTQRRECPIQDAYRIEATSLRRLGREPEAADALQRCIELAPKSCLADECRALQGGTHIATPT